MPSFKNHAAPATDFQVRLAHLKRREQQSVWLTLASMVLLLVTVVVAFWQRDFIFSIWGISQTVEQLHVPASIDLSAFNAVESTDYFGRLMSWVGWLMLKVCAAFFGAFILLRLFKKHLFFKQRFKSFIMKVVAWLIAFIVIFSSLSLLQQQRNKSVQRPYQSLLQYDHNIQQSQLAQYLAQSEEPAVVQDYLLLQSALLHRPVDQAAAMVYAERLIKAENTSADFASYGLKPEIIWIVQHQLFGKSVTPMAQRVEPIIAKANRASQLAAWVLYLCIVLTGLMAAMAYLISQQLKKRRTRIEVMMLDQPSATFASPSFEKHSDSFKRKS